MSLTQLVKSMYYYAKFKVRTPNHYKKTKDSYQLNSGLILVYITSIIF